MGFGRNARIFAGLVALATFGYATMRSLPRKTVDNLHPPQFEIRTSAQDIIARHAQLEYASPFEQQKPILFYIGQAHGEGGILDDESAKSQVRIYRLLKDLVETNAVAGVYVEKALGKFEPPPLDITRTVRPRIVSANDTQLEDLLKESPGRNSSRCRTVFGP